MVTSKEIAHAHGWSVKEVERFIYNQKIPHKTLGNYFAVSESDAKVIENSFSKIYSVNKEKEDAYNEEIEDAHSKTFEERIEKLKENQADGYWEYKVIDIGTSAGKINLPQLQQTLNDLGLMGWQLKCAYTNETGFKGTTTLGLLETYTEGQNILIFERYVKIS